MPEPIITKRCIICKKNKPLAEFHKSTERGQQNRCKVCKSKWSKKYNQTVKGKAVRTKSINRYQQTEKGKIAYKNFRIRHANQRHAVNAVNALVRNGKYPKPTTLRCSCCFNDAEHYHHYKGYDKKNWLDVIPVCYRCHIILHKILRTKRLIDSLKTSA